MDFSITTLFALSASNTLPTTGTTANLTANQFGVFKPDYTPATAGNVAVQPYIILAQGRPQTIPGLGTKKSDKIYAKNVIEWYKVTAFASAANQITDISDFSATCGEDVTISVRLRSFYIDTAYFNGLTKSFTVTTPCCECGEDPCTEVNYEALIEEFVALINAQTDYFGTQNFITAEKINNFDTTFKLRLIGKVLATEPTSPDITNYTQQYDRLHFWAFAYRGPETSQDFNVWDSCDPFATVTTVQESTYPRGNSKEAKALEMDYNSYNTAPIAKRIFSNVNFNNAFTSNITDGTFYDFYYLKFKSPMNNEHNAVVPQDEAVIILNPTAQNAGTIAVLTAFLGTPVDETGSTSTTTTTTSSTTTTTTTV